MPRVQPALGTMFGLESIILSGFNGGDGVVVGTRSVVTSTVPPFAIVVGNAARIVGYRFSPEHILELQRIAWWNWSEQKIRQCESDFYLGIDEFLRRHAQRWFGSYEHQGRDSF